MSKVITSQKRSKDAREAATRSNKEKRKELQAAREEANSIARKQGLPTPHQAKQRKHKAEWEAAGKPGAKTTAYGNLAVMQTTTVFEEGKPPRKVEVISHIEPCCDAKSYIKCPHYIQRFPLGLPSVTKFLFTRDAYRSAALMK